MARTVATREPNSFRPKVAKRMAQRFKRMWLWGRRNPPLCRVKTPFIWTMTASLIMVLCCGCISYPYEVGSEELARTFSLRNPLVESIEIGGQGVIYSDPEFRPLYPVLYQSYETVPFGTMTITNDSLGFVEDVSVKFSSSTFTAAASVVAQLREIDLGESVQIPITALFSEQILRTIEGGRIVGSVSIEYTYDLAPVQVELPVSVPVQGRNAIEWTDDRRVAAFATSLDGNVRQLGVLASLIGSELPFFSPSLATAIAAYEALRVQGVSYVIDPTSSYQELSATGSIDYVQFPAETLRIRAGDCDDLSVLYAAILQAVGVDTAFVFYPGHMLVAIRLDMDPAEARRTLSSSDSVLIRDDEVWLPVETTALDSSFYDAWAVAGASIRRYKERDELTLMPTSVAWAEYPAVQLPDSLGVSLPSRDELESAARSAIHTVALQESAVQASPLLDILSRHPDDARTRNRLGALYARFGLYEAATEQFDTIIRNNEYPPALTNRASLAYAEGDFQTAIGFYERSLVERESSFASWIGLSRAQYASGLREEASVSWERARRIDSEAAARFDQLGFRSTLAGARASGGPEAQPIVWDD